VYAYLDVALFDDDMRGVAELDELLHGLLVHVADRHLGGARLRQLAREHRAEVRAACRQDYSAQHILYLSGS
jgi:hypothetical protein